MASEKPQADSAAWKPLDPTEMSFEQLQAASRAISASYGAAQATLNQLNMARVCVLGEINHRFGTDMPGIPAFGQLPEYPAEFVAKYDFVEPEPEQDAAE